MKNSEYTEQLSEIHEIIAESRSGFEGGGWIGLVWGILTAAAIAVLMLFPNLGSNARFVWAAHNLLGWTASLILFRRISSCEGRVSQRGIFVLRLWAVWTLAIWIAVGVLNKSMSEPEMVFAGILSLMIGMGAFVTGLLSESRFSQITGVALMVVGPLLAIYFSSVLAFGAVVLALFIFGLGSWLIREK